MHITSLTMRNFRNFQSASLKFQKGVNTILGENGSGKTNALYALQLLLDDGLARRAAHLRESDFNRGLDDWRGHWIIISVEFTELDSSEGCQILRHSTGTLPGATTGTYTLIFRPNPEVRRALHALSEESAGEDEFNSLRS